MTKPHDKTPAWTSGQAGKNASTRRRATWLYYTYGLTQLEVADRLGISRSTVIRMLDKARSLGEVQVTVATMPDDCSGLEASLEMQFDLTRAIVVPDSPEGDPETIAQGVGAALSAYLSTRITNGIIVGIGWGRTLGAMLDGLAPASLNDTTILSLLGGITSNQRASGGDVSWRMAERLGAKCLMMPAPLMVNTPETKQILIDECGLNQLFEMARKMDLAVISCGETVQGGTSLTEYLIPTSDYNEVIERGAVADVLCHFLDAEGRSVPAGVSQRIMSVAPEDLAVAREVVLACGGIRRARAILASLRRFKCKSLVTDESAAKAVLDLVRASDVP